MLLHQNSTRHQKSDDDPDSGFRILEVKLIGNTMKSRRSSFIIVES
eukprot:08504.XXX_215847_215984_1 [CDS] Oithona nana genome sequencing.